MSHSLQDHSSLTRDSTQTLEVKSPSLNHWMPRNSQDTDNLSLFIDDEVRFFWLRDAHSLFSLPYSVQFSSFAQSCLTLCDPMDCGMAGLPVHHQLPKHWSKCFNALVHAFLDQVLWLVLILHCRGKSQDHGSMPVLFMSCRHIQWVAISFSRGSSWPRD